MRFTVGATTIMGKKILIADDEHFIRKLGTRILNGEGYDIIQAENGSQAVGLYQKDSSNVVLVILDITMPDMSGVEVYRKLYQMNPHVRVIMCSGYGEDDVPTESTVFFIQKPFSIDLFIKSVEKVLEMNEEEIRKNNERVLNYKAS